jgi:NADH:ubiquinone oxidoreductase subunit E
VDNNHPIDVVICLGSSCFARGNAENLRDLKTYLEHYNIAAKFRTSGKLCGNKCTSAPTIAINGVEYERVQPGTAVALLERALQERGKKC